MESTNVVIARLVLGYLKEEKCRIAYKDFFKTCQYLQGDFRTRTKYLPTRFMGLTLQDLLSEYFEISTIVQGRLEATNYYNECGTRKSLVHQLQYLLNKGSFSRMSTPCPRSPYESNLDESSPSHSQVDNVSDVETTPAHTLPGNTSLDDSSYLNKTIRRKLNSKSNKSTSQNENEDISEVLAQTLLENKEFHEKIAETINKVAEKQMRGSFELDKTVKTVVEVAEADPIFDKILDYITGTSEAIENCKGVESSSTTSSVAKDSALHNEHTSRRTQRRLSSDELMDDSESLKHSSVPTVDEQNDEAVRSIIATSKSNPQDNNHEGQMNSDVTIFDGSLDNYLTSNTCNAITQTQPVQNQVYINATGGLVMLPSGVASTVNLHGDARQQYYLVNKPELNVAAKNLTEQDILAMPTVIVNEEKSLSTAQPVLTTTRVVPQVIMPKPTVQVSSGYLNSYSGNGLKNVMYPKSKKSKVRKVSPKEAVTTRPNNLCIPNESKSLPDLDKEEVNIPIKTSTCQTNPEDDRKRNKVTPVSATVRVKKSPKSGSHIRNLKFSTPPKITSTQRKSMHNDEKTGNKTPHFIHKKQAAKSLFPLDNTSASNREMSPPIPKESNVTSNKFSKTWDADLRATVVPEIDDKITLKKNKSTPVKKLKKKLKKIGVAQNQLNTTEQNAALIEAALQTPVKLEKQDNEDSDNNFKNSIDSENCKMSDDNISKEKEMGVNDGGNNTEKSVDGSKKSSPNKCHKDDTNKTILSPSNLNTNKRTIVSSDMIKNRDLDETVKFITPEMIKNNFHYPIKANRNISELLETPTKDEFLLKSPVIETPNTCVNTPFTKMLEANLKGIDITSLPTPNIPITPNFPPFTPNVEVSPYSNRPTDYSTSSSYYVPSDSEPNRSLEANVTELEKKPIIILTDVVINENTEKVQKTKSEKLPNNDAVKNKNASVNEHLRIFNKNVIGKKNLSLMKRNSNESISFSDDSSSESSNEMNLSSCNLKEKNRETTTSNKKSQETPKRIYSLRNRTTTAHKKEEMKPVQLENKVPSDKDQIKKSMSQANNCNNKYISSKNNKFPGKQTVQENECDVKEALNVTTEQLRLKKELNEKLLRTVNKIKASEKATVKKNSRSTNSKFMKIKLNPAKNKKKIKTGTTKKTVQKTNMKVDSNLDTHVSQGSANEYKTSKNFKTTSTIKDLEKVDKSSSDTEAQNLIEGLKERGIHLMKNKTSTNKNSQEPSNCMEQNTSNNTCDSLSKSDDNNSSKEKILETSTSELEFESRDTYDVQIFEGEHECVIFNESKRITKTFNDYDLKVLEKTFIGKVFIEELNEEIDVPVVFSPFYTLLDIPSTKNSSQQLNAGNQKTKVAKKTERSTASADSTTKTQTNEGGISLPQNFISNDLSSSVTAKELEETEFPSSKKRKIEKEECRVPEGKDCKNLLQQINVDTFLNNIHGES